MSENQASTEPWEDGDWEGDGLWDDPDASSERDRSASAPALDFTIVEATPSKAPSLPPAPRSVPDPPLRLKRPLFADAVFGEDPDYERLERMLGEDSEAIEARYKPRELRFFADGARLPFSIEVPIEGFDEDVMDGLLEQQGWPARTLQLKIYRGARYLVSQTFPGEPAPEDGDDGDEGDGRDGHTPFDERGFLEKLGDKLLSDEGPQLLADMLPIVQAYIAGVGPGLAEILGMIEARKVEARLKAEDTYRRRQLTEGGTGSQHHAAPAPAHAHVQ